MSNEIAYSDLTDEQEDQLERWEAKQLELARIEWAMGEIHDGYDDECACIECMASDLPVGAQVDGLERFE